MSAQSDRIKRFLVPVVIIMVGTMWLLNVLQVLPDVDWLWTGGLAGAGILVLAFGGVNKATMVAGPWLLIASIASLLRETGRLRVSYEIPILTVVFGILLLLVELLKLPLPKCFREEGEGKDED